MMRVAAFALLLIVGFANSVREDLYYPRPRRPVHLVIDYWYPKASSIVGVRLDAHESVTLRSQPYFAYAATILAVFKNDPRLPPLESRLTLFSQSNLLSSEEGPGPWWGTDNPLPLDRHWV